MNLPNLMGSVRKKTFAATAIRPARRRPRLDVQTLEAREVPAVLPAPLIDPHSHIIAEEPQIGGGGSPVINGDGSLAAFAPSTAINPNNPFQIFEAHVVYTDAAQTQTRIVVQYSENAGSSWGFAEFPALEVDFKATTNPAAPIPFTNVSNPSVAFDNFGNGYVTYLETNADRTAGRVVLRKYSFNNGVPPTEVDISNASANGTSGVFWSGFEHVIYKWVDGDEAYNPVVAIDTNRGTFNDTNPNGTPANQSDPLAASQTTAATTKVFVAFNTRNLTPDGRTIPAGYDHNPNVIRMAVSDDGGRSFGAAVIMNNRPDQGGDGQPADLGNFVDQGDTAERALFSQPQMTFTQGRAGQANSGGKLITAWTDFSQRLAPSPAPTIITDSHTFTTTTIPEAIEVTNTAPMPITDAINPGSNPHIPQETLYPINVTSANGLTRIDNVSVSVNIHHNDLAQLRIELVAPSGQAVTLVRNGVDAFGDDTGDPVGITGENLGIVNENLPNFSGWNVGTVFTDNASRVIWDGTEPRTGTFRPEAGSLNGTFGVAGVQITGTWRIRITDFRESGSPPPPSYVRQVTLRLQQNFRNGQDVDLDTGYTPIRGSFNGRTFPTASPASSVGIGPGLSLATDNTLGAYSPYQNRVYMSYVAPGPQVRLIFSDDGGGTWSATSANLGSGFLPKVALDPTTGTLAVAYYTTQFGTAESPVSGDAAGVRAATMFRTAINMPNFRPSGTPTGSIEFSPATYVNPVEQYQDQIRSKTMTFEPITSNGPRMGPEGYGNNLGLTLYNGRVSLVYAGNLNEAGGFIRTQDMTIAAGPRVVAGDTGPVLSDAEAVKSVTSLGTPFQPFPVNQTGAGSVVTYNDTFASDGRRQFDGFVVTFDRIIDPATFTPDDVTIKFRDPDDDPITGGFDIPTTDYTIIPLDNLLDTVDGSFQGSKRFLVKMNPGKELSAVGTYSYSINANVSDRIRNRDIVYVNQAVTRTFSTSPNAPIADAVGGNPGIPTVSGVNVTLPPGVVVGKVAVEVNITHPNVSDLQLTLISPALTRVTLVRAGDSGAGANYVATIFDDDGELAIQSDLPPHSDARRYRPFETLQQYRSTSARGTWRLEVIDTVAGEQGFLNSWTLHLTPADLVTTNSPGNLHDQDSDGTEGEANQDIFAMPNPVANTPFALPYVSGSLPVVIPGPYVQATRPTGQPASTDNLVKNAAAKSIDVQFDRVIKASTFTAADVLRIIGPQGDVPLTGVTVVPISGLNGTPLADGLTNSRFFRVTFAEQKVSGYYQIQLGSNIEDTTGNKLDTNQNAGVANLSGAAVGAPVDTRTFDKGSFNTALTPGTTTVVPLDVNSAFLVQRATVNLSIDLADGGNMRNIDAQLIAPDGTSVLLFINAPASGSANSMINTTFLDAQFTNDTPPRPVTPVQLGGSFDNGFFNPVQPLAQLNGHPTVSGNNRTWRLVIRNKGAEAGTVSKFVLNLDQSRTGTGLGEVVADQASVGFRIFQVDGSNPTARGNWTPIGAAGQGQTNTVGRVSAVAVDPSDPSGNTVYAAGASGGVWRTTNFLTRDVDGPTWIPLTDFGPTNAINVGSIALYPDVNGDPLKTAILVGTGSEEANRIQFQEMLGTEDLRFDGVGFLLSEDAGKTWQVLDSINNFDTAANKYRPIDDAGRDHLFVGAVVRKVVFERNKNAFAPFRQIIYAAVGQGTATTANVGGLYRSLDGGRTWAKIYTPPANAEVSDFVIAEASAQPTSGNRPQLAYLAVEGVGMFRTTNLNSASPSFTQMLGGNDRPTVDAPAGGKPVDDPQGVPNGDKSKIAIAVPFFTTKVVTDPNTGTPTVVQDDPLANNYYQRWVYAAVGNDNGTLDGLYMSKDAGDNWVRVYAPGPNDPAYFFTDFGANHSLTVAVDPTDPNIVYLGSDALVRIDTTFINDAYNLSAFQHSNADGGLIRPETTGGVQVANRAGDDGINPELFTGLISNDPFNLDPSGQPLDSFVPLSYFQELDPILRADPRNKWNFVNLVRDPYNPFRTDTPLATFNIEKFTNTGADIGVAGVVEAIPFRDYEWMAHMVTFVDPLTGKARVIYGSDEGVTTFVAESNGSLNQVNTFYQPPLDGPAGEPDTELFAGTNSQVIYDKGTAATPLPDGTPVLPPAVPNSSIQVNGDRNGNLQVARFYSGDVQPSLLAASISHSLALGAARRLTDAVASSDGVLQTGNDEWGHTGRNGRANYVAVDQTGTGAVYILTRGGSESLDPRLPAPPFPALPVNPANLFQVQLEGLEPISRTQGLFDRGFAQWDETVRRFAVNPIDPNGIIIGSRIGNLYRTTDQGLNWFIQGDTQNLQADGVLDGTYTTALAFGAPELDATSLNDTYYVGTKAGRIFVTTTGGGTNQDPDPLKKNWYNISNGLPGGEVIQKILPNPIRGTHELYAVTENGVYWMKDWKVGLTDPTNPDAIWQNLTNNIPLINHNGFFNPEWSSSLNGTNVRSPELLSMAVDWRPIYSPTPGQPILYVGGNGGVFRAIRDGVDPTKTAWRRFTGVAPDGSEREGGGLPIAKVTDLDLATGNSDPNSGRVLPAGSPDMLVATTLGRGSFIIALGKPTGVSGPRVVKATPTVPQAGPVDKVTIEFDQYIDVTSFTPSDVKVTDPNGNPVAVEMVRDVTPVVVGQPNLHNVWEIVFDSTPTTGTDTRLRAEGAYQIVVGPGVLDGGGTPMDQDGDGINGEPVADQFRMTVVIGQNDLTDFVLDSYLKLLGRLPTTTEYTGVNVAAINTARLTALQTVVKELLSVYNPTAGQPSEARQRLVERLFRITDGTEATEIGNLLPAPYVLSNIERDTLVADLKAGRKSPESIIIYIMTKPEYFAQAGGTAQTFLNKVYLDLFKGTTVAFNRLSATVQANQLNQAQTAAGRSTLVRSLVNGATVTYDHDANPTTAMISTNYRNNQVALVYQKLLGRAPTAAEVTAGRSLIARPLAANNLNGHEWLYWKILSSQEYFNLQTQDEPGTSPDDQLHTQRSWVNGVITDRFFRTTDPDGDGYRSQITERSLFSQKVLNLTKAKRAAFERALVFGNEYRTIKIKEYYQLVLSRLPSDPELASQLTAMKNGRTLTGVVSGLLGSTEYYNAKTNASATTAVRNRQWAQAVYQTLLARAATPAEETALVNKIPTLGRAGASVSVLNSQDTTNGPTWFNKLTTQAFALLLNRTPTPAELTAYANFLKTNRWENMLVDIMANGVAIVVEPTLPREFWEVAQ